ncbi:MAG: zinc metallopeptidase [Candidatus Eiseniibacteriota bacterium]
MMFPFFDPTMLLVLPGIAFALWAQWRVKSTFDKYSKVRAASGRTGRHVAESLLAAYGVHGISVEPVGGRLSDHYDPTHHVVRLSQGVYDSDSVAALGVAAHEVGHAIQDAKGYMPMRWRWALLGPANLGSTLALPLAFIGFLLGAGGVWLLNFAIILFTATVLFHLVTLPVEFNASARAYAHLRDSGITSPDEAAMAKKVLDAAALTYVASAAVALLSLLRLVLIRNSRD